MGIPKPPTISVEILERPHTFRFICSAAGGYTITRANLCNLVQINIVAAGGVNSYVTEIAGIRLTRVRIWSQPSALGSVTSSSSVEWLGNNNDSITMLDASNSISPAFVDSSPPVDSSASWWSQAGTNGTESLFALAVALGDVIDVVCQVVMVSTELPATLHTDATGAATLGTTYGGYLDGYASKKLKPQGWTPTP